MQEEEISAIKISVQTSLLKCLTQEMLLSQEGGDYINISKQLSKKYEEVKIIYESAASLVILVRHISLNQERIIKRIAKDTYTASDSGSMKEALILLNLRHPNIPILYDLEEDENYYYMVEEYIVGESMADYLYLHQSISHRELVRIAVELYDVLSYLHNLKVPICYQDMKLEHIYISKGRIVLIDYGIATYLKGNEQSVCATISYASKAQLSGICDTSNDIYNTKMALKRIYDKSLEKKSLKIERLLNVDNNLSADEEKSRWLAISSDINKEMKHLDITVAVVGNDTGIGVSHIAISLTCYLNNTGLCAYYLDCDSNNIIERIMARDRSFHEQDNIIYHDCYKGIRTPGEAAADTIPPKGIYVKDYGGDIASAKSCDIILYVISSRPYKSNEIDDIAIANASAIIINPANLRVGVDVAKLIKKRVYSFPLDQDPTSITKTKNKMFYQLVKAVRIKSD